MAVFPQELLDEITDDLSEDKATLLNLIRSGPEFGRRARMLFYRDVHLSTHNIQQFYDLLSSNGDIGNYVHTVHWQFSPPNSCRNASFQGLLRISPGGEASLVHPNTAQLSQVHHLHLEGLDVDSQAISHSVLHDILPPPASITSLSIHYSHWAHNGCLGRLTRFLLGYPHLTSLELVRVHVANVWSYYTPPVPTQDWHQYHPTIRELTLADSDTPFFHLIPNDYLSLHRNVSRLLIVRDPMRIFPSEPNVGNIEKVMNSFQGRLEFFYLSVPYAVIAAITGLSLIHLVLQSPHVAVARNWLEEITKPHWPDLDAKRLQYLDIIFPWDALRDWQWHESFFLGFGRMLNQWELNKSIHVRFIIACGLLVPPCSRINLQSLVDNTLRMKAFPQCNHSVQFVVVNAELQGVYREFKVSQTLAHAFV
ncbi:hypothetical protein BDZ89DRAFT_1107259 [Hymenopellis radicata]|nr:hypothetical protein BDZ89DRAFT_1107259 [Hymenopellis radicata]